MALSEKRVGDDALRACEALVRVLSNDPRIHHAASFAWNTTRRLNEVGASIHRLVVREMGLPHPWLPRMLTSSFAAMLVGHSGALQFEPTVALAGRGSKAGGAHVSRDVEWYYRAELKDPPDSIRSLAKEYATPSASNRSKETDSRSVVQAGIRRAKTLLAVFEGEKLI